MQGHDSLTSFGFEPIPSDPEVLYEQLCDVREKVILAAANNAEQALLHYLETSAGYADFTSTLEKWGQHGYLGKLATAPGIEGSNPALSPQESQPVGGNKMAVETIATQPKAFDVERTRSAISELYEQGGHHAETT